MFLAFEVTEVQTLGLFHLPLYHQTGFLSVSIRFNIDKHQWP